MEPPATIYLIFLLLTIGYIGYSIAKDVFLNQKIVFVFFQIEKPRIKILIHLFAFCFVFFLWSFLSYSKLINQNYLPTPFDTFQELFHLFTKGNILVHIAISLRRILIGFTLASIIGVALGSVAGVFNKPNAFISPINSAFRYIPATAFISLTIIWFGIGESGKIALIFIAIIFYIIQMTADVVRLTPKVYLEAAQLLGANRFEIFQKIILSYSFPEILAVLRVNIGAAWTFLIVSELVASQSGLGYLMATSQRFLQTPRLFAIMIILGVLGFLTDLFFQTLIRKASIWKIQIA